MKNLRPLILGIIIGALATYFFCPRQAVEDSSLEIVKVIKPKGVISVDKAKALNKNWTDYREAAVDSAARKQGRNKDDRSVWWSIDDIENYIAYSKQQTDSLGYDMTGFRVYLGVYGKNAGQSKKNLTTMFMVPTVGKSIQKAGVNLFNVNMQGNGDCPTCPPLNEGTGGGGGYPQ